MVTGVSGSGKSTLAFDILFNEGQRRYLESLNAYARSIVQPAGRPEVDAVYGIPPTVAIEQRLSRGGRKSTVATTTEVWHFLRLLWVKLGTQRCVQDGAEVRPQSVESIAAQLLRDHKRPARGPAGAAGGQPQGCLHRPGQMGQGARPHPPAGGWRVPEGRPLAAAGPLQGAHAGAAGGRPGGRAAHEAELRALLAKALDLGKGVLHLLAPLDGLAEAMAPGAPPLDRRVKVFSTKRACPQCGTSYPELDPRMFSYNSKHGWCTSCVGTGLTLTREQRKA